MQDVSETCGLICDKATIFAGFCDSGPRVLVQVLESSVNLYNTAKGSITEGKARLSFSTEVTFCNTQIYLQYN
jgi:hypothetical protein